MSTSVRELMRILKKLPLDAQVEIRGPNFYDHPIGEVSHYPIINKVVLKIEEENVC